MNITFNKSNEFKNEILIKYLKNKNFEEKINTTDYQQHIFSNFNILITIFEKKILIQGPENDNFINIIKTLNNCKYVFLDEKNREKINKLINYKHNSLICPKCNKGSQYLIKGDIINNELTFNLNICNHKINPNQNIFTVYTRILPDINILYGRILSKCIDLGYFNNFEIVIPSFILDATDVLFNTKKKKTITSEIELLKIYENNSKIKIFNCPYDNKIMKKEELEQKEDKIILKLANLTNSILFTQDSNLQGKAILQNRPTIYLDPQLSGQLNKIITRD